MADTELKPCRRWECSCGNVMDYTPDEIAAYGEPGECGKCFRERLEEIPHEQARPAGEPVAWQRRKQYALPTDPPGKQYSWEYCSRHEATDHWDKLPGYEYRPLYATPQPAPVTGGDAVRQALYANDWLEFTRFEGPFPGHDSIKKQHAFIRAALTSPTAPAEDERAKIVAWLDAQNREHGALGWNIGLLALSIQRGDHLSTKGVG